MYFFYNKCLQFDSWTLATIHGSPSAFSKGCSAMTVRIDRPPVSFQQRTTMRLVSFNPFRSIGIPGVRPLKPEDWFKNKEEVCSADWIVFPEYWQVNVLVYGLKKSIFPSASTYHLGHDKVEMIRAFEALAPEHTPVTKIAPSTDYHVNRIIEEFTFPFVCKDVRSSMGQGVFLVEDAGAFVRYAETREVLFVQEFLPIDRDIRVVVIGNRAVSAYWRMASNGAFHTNLARGGVLSFGPVPAKVIELVERVAFELGIDHAGFDVALVDDHLYLLEFNVMFGGEGLRRLGVRTGPLVFEYLLSQSTGPWKPKTPPLSKAG